MRDAVEHPAGVAHEEAARSARRLSGRSAEQAREGRVAVDAHPRKPGFNRARIAACSALKSRKGLTPDGCSVYSRSSMTLSAGVALELA